MTGGTDVEKIKTSTDARTHATPAAERQREALRQAIAFKKYEFDAHGVEMNQRYNSDAVVTDGQMEPSFDLDAELHHQPTTWPGARVPLALYGALQAEEGVALKQTVNAWAAAADAEKTARFASAESIRWLEWGMRSYQDIAMGLALIVLGPVVKRAGLRIGMAFLIGVSGLALLAQGWIAGTDGFTSAQSLAIVIGWAASLAWMVWLAMTAWSTTAKEESQANEASV